MFSTCIGCGQAIFSETLPTGRQAFVAEDGWGSICGDTASGEHTPADVVAVSYVPAVLDAARP